MFEKVYSKIFSQKLLNEFTASERADIEKAVQRVLLNPNIHDYKRDYLKPHLQEHPSDKQITIFFEILSNSNKVYFVWINDQTCLHNTHKNFGEDPCVKEFNRQKAACRLEVYDTLYHDGDFSVKPRADYPVYMSFKKYDAAIFSNVLNDGNTHYAMNINCMQDDEEIFDHYSRYLEHIVDHFRKNKLSFEFRIFDYEVELIQKINAAILSADWVMSKDGGLTIWKIL